jgi:hypothetical protein
MNPKPLVAALGPFALVLLAGTGDAQSPVPSATRHAAELVPDDDVPESFVPPIDLAAVRAEDVERQELGLAPRYAIPHAVSHSPFTGGALELVGGDTVVWRLRVRAPLAVSINLGFERFALPEGARLLVYSRDRAQVLRPFTSADNEAHGQLWTPIVRAEEVVVELTVPAERFDDEALQLELTHVGYGYRGFGTKDGAAESGSCNVDVACPAGDDWQNEIPAVAVISTGGSTFCTGFMVNNTANDRKPYFMTANHCGIGAGNAPSLVVFWNYETSVCGGTPDGSLSQFNTGSVHRASYGPSDFTLVELDDDPDSGWGITFAGWDRTGADEPGAIAIHHPDTDEKRISFENDPTTTTSYLGGSVPGDSTHVRVFDWDVGTTEPGSSGSPLFNPAHRVIGQLHGGFAACGNNSADWYGKFSVSWNGGGTPSSRLSDWLDPGGTGALTADTLGAGLAVSPSGSVTHEGVVGGPFTNPVTVYTLSNDTATPISYSVSLDTGVGFLLDGGAGPVAGVLAAGGGSAQVTVSLDPAAAGFAQGLYAETVAFDDLTNGISNTRQHTLEVGRATIYSFDLTADPGWATQGGWAYGEPRGMGGVAHGLPDPVGGATGFRAYGYNLLGDYPDNLPEQHLTSTPINCTGASGVKVRYMRWLNVEQPTYDHAYFRVSNDGVNFTTVWENGSEITDSSWVQEELDISAIADGQATVYLRWTMGSTDSSWQYAGWNVDDVEISAIAPPEFQTYGAGHPGSGGLVPSLGGSGSTATNGVFTLAAANGLGGAPAYLVVGLAPNSLPAFGGTILVNNIVAAVPRKLSGPAGVPGAGGFGLNVSFADPSLVGLSLYMQVWVGDAGASEGLALSDGLQVFATY